MGFLSDALSVLVPGAVRAEESRVGCSEAQLQMIHLTLRSVKCVLLYVLNS